VTGRSIAISVLAHAAVLALVARCDTDRPGRVEEAAPPQAIEVVEVPVPMVSERPIQRSFDSVHPERGRAAAESKGSGRTGGKPAPRGRLVIEPEVRSGGGSGDGSGIGSGFGCGLGCGFGGAGPPPLALCEAPTAPSPRAAPRSKARPARLIFPKKHREVEDGDVFVALLTVDDDGLVVGVRLTRGIGGRRDEVAAREVWRFRYDPARDAAGKPIRSKVEQRFMLDR
jgi:hypothetical protein